MLARIALTLLTTFALTRVPASAQDLFAPAPPPSVIARAQALDQPKESTLPTPRILDVPADPIEPLPRILDEEPNPVVGNALDESYEGIESTMPNRFGSSPEQRTWGLAGGRFIVNGNKTAPNGVVYTPYFSLDMIFNFALTRDRRLYGFVDARFWAQSNKDKVAQHALDFSKRQFDLTPGVAWNFYGRFEARFFAYSYNNLNRGTTLTNPIGYKDGVALEGRYYFGGTDFDRGVYNFLSVGYYLSKEMIGNDGEAWFPGGFIKWSYNIPLWEQRIFLYTMGEFILEKPYDAKWVWLDTGISGRPFASYPMLDLRAGNETNVDIVSGKTLTMWYIGARFAF